MGLVNVKSVRKLVKPVPLKAMKQNPTPKDMGIIWQFRSSVAPVTEDQRDPILEMAS